MVLEPALSEEALTILRRGAEHADGRCFSLRSDARSVRDVVRDLEARGFVRYIGGDWMVTDAARAAIGARSAEEVSADWYRSRIPPAPAVKAAHDADPRSSYQYAVMKKLGYVTFPAFKHADHVKSIVVSRDGGGTGHAWLVRRPLIIQPETVGDLMLVSCPRDVVNKASRKAGTDLLGVPPALSVDREWTLEDLTTWEKLKRAAAHVNAMTHKGGRRKPLLTRNQAA